MDADMTNFLAALLFATILSTIVKMTDIISVAIFTRAITLMTMTLTFASIRKEL